MASVLAVGPFKKNGCRRKMVGGDVTAEAKQGKLQVK